MDETEEISVYVMGGEIVAAQATNDDLLLVRRLDAAGILDADRVVELTAMARTGESVFGILLEEVDANTMERVLHQRFLDNLARFVGIDAIPSFTELSAVFVENIQIGHDSRRLIGDCVHLWEMASKVDLDAELVAAHPEEAAGAQALVIASLQPERTVRQILVELPLEPVAARAMMAQMVETGIVAHLTELELELEADEEEEEASEEEEPVEDQETMEVPVTPDESSPTEVIEGPLAIPKNDLTSMETEVVASKPRRPRKLGDLIRSRVKKPAKEAAPPAPIEEEDEEDGPTLGDTTPLPTGPTEVEVEVGWDHQGEVAAEQESFELVEELEPAGVAEPEAVEEAGVGVEEEEPAESVPEPEEVETLAEAETAEPAEEPAEAPAPEEGEVPGEGVEPPEEGEAADEAAETWGDQLDEVEVEEPEEELLEDEVVVPAPTLDVDSLLHPDVDLDEGDLEAFADHDHDRSATGDGVFSTEQHNLDRVEVLDLEPSPEDEIIEVDEAPQARFGAKPLSDEEALRKIQVANDAVAHVIAAFDASEGKGRGRETVQLLLDGSPHRYAPLLMDVQLTTDDRLPESRLMRNLHARPVTEHRQLLNQGLVDLIERALSLAMDEITDDEAIDALLENTAGYRQRIGL